MTETDGPLPGVAASHLEVASVAGFAPAASDQFHAFAASLALLVSRGLRVFTFERNGAAVQVDGMRRRSAGELAPLERSPAIRYEPPSAYIHSEPRIRLFVDLLGRLLASFSFTFQGEPVEVDGIRLANLRRWARYRAETLFDNVSPVTSACSARCVFCYREGTRHGKMLGLSPRMLGIEEAQTRAKYWRPDRKLGLPPRQADTGEAFVNPQIFRILDVVRRQDPTGVITLLTNGDYLDPACVDRLRACMPLMVVLSLNSADIRRRTDIMCPRNAGNGVRAPGLLRNAGVPYIGSIVAEQRLGLADIERTIRYLDTHGALRVRVLLPGYTKNSIRRALPGLEKWWREVADLVLSIRETVDCPVAASPALYWDTEVTPRIEGLHARSIAKRAGLRVGDTVVKVNGRPVATKAQALVLLGASCEASQPCALRIRRGGRLLNVALAAPRGGQGSLPAPAEWDPGNERYGIFMNRGLELSAFAWIRSRLGRARRKKRVLLFSSQLAQPHVRELAGHLQDFERGHDVRVTSADHRFWGGNIQVADLHVVDDYIDKINDFVRNAWKPDLAFIPDSFLLGGWGFDVAGNSYRRIAAETGVRIILVPVTKIME